MVVSSSTDCKLHLKLAVEEASSAAHMAAGTESSAAQMREDDTRTPVKIEPLAEGSPSGSDGSRGENGSSQEGTSEDSLDNSYDAPLDFSTKKPRREVIPALNADQSPIPRSPCPINGRRRTDEAPSPDVRRRLNGPDLHGEDSNSSIRSDTLSQPGDKIGEPQVAFPGGIPAAMMPSLLPGMGDLPAGVVPNPALLASLPMFQDPRGTAARTNSNQGGNGKNLRPFKAYPKDPLSLPLGYYAIPGMLPIPGMDPSALQALGAANSEDLVSQYRQYLSQVQEQTKPSPVRQESKEVVLPKTMSTPIVMPTSPPTTSAIAQSVSSPGSASSSSTSTSPAITVAGDTPTMTTSSSNKRKMGRMMPEENKDGAYWDRRRKNNEAAKRSRDARRAKEDEIAIRAALLEQENLKLRVEVAALKNETAKLRCMLYNS